MSAVRILEIYLNISTGREVDVLGNDVPTGNRMRLWRASARTIVRVHLYQTGTTYFEPPAGAAWYFGLDNTLQDDDIEDGNDPVATYHADFNQSADWSEVSPTAGKICFPINTATEELSAKFADAPESIEMHGEIWMQDPTLGRQPLVQWPIDVLNVYCNYGSDAPLAESLGQVLIKADGNDTVIFKPDGTEVIRY